MGLGDHGTWIIMLKMDGSRFKIRMSVFSVPPPLLIKDMGSDRMGLSLVESVGLERRPFKVNGQN